MLNRNNSRQKEILCSSLSVFLRDEHQYFCFVLFYIDASSLETFAAFNCVVDALFFGCRIKHAQVVSGEKQKVHVL